MHDFLARAGPRRGCGYGQARGTGQVGGDLRSFGAIGIRSAARRLQGAREGGNTWTGDMGHVGACWGMLGHGSCCWDGCRGRSAELARALTRACARPARQRMHDRDRGRSASPTRRWQPRAQQPGRHRAWPLHPLQAGVVCAAEPYPLPTATRAAPAARACPSPATSAPARPWARAAIRPLP
jgi:hypothetical protein